MQYHLGPTRPRGKKNERGREHEFEEEKDREKTISFKKKKDLSLGQLGSHSPDEFIQLLSDSVLLRRCPKRGKKASKGDSNRNRVQGERN